LEPTTGKLKYLFYLDILGFKDLINEKSPEDLYTTIDKCLDIFYTWESFNELFSTLYFSDTIIFYQTSEEYKQVSFLDIYGIAGQIYSKLLSEGIPVRGAITYGEFTVKLDSNGRNNIYFGGAFIEAVDLEKNVNWVGIIISRSAYIGIDKKIFDAFIRENVFEKREDGCLLLNPFYQIRASCFDVNAYEAAGETFLDELKAVKYLLSKEKEFSLKAPCKEYSKYANTVAFIKRVMKDGLYEWTLKMVNRLVPDT